MKNNLLRKKYEPPIYEYPSPLRAIVQGGANPMTWHTTTAHGVEVSWDLKIQIMATAATEERLAKRTREEAE